MAFTSTFLAGVAQLLADGNVAVYKPTGSYGPDELGIYLGAQPASPDRAVVLTTYSWTDDPTQAESSVRVQLLTRGTRDIRTSEDVQDAAFDVLQNLPRQVIGGATVEGCWRRSTGYLGLDENGRHLHSSNYDLFLHRPGPNRS